MTTEHQAPTGRGNHSAARVDLETAPIVEAQLARLEFAEALGRRQLAQQPQLFDQLLVGRWDSFEELLECYITEAGVAERLAGVGPGGQRLPDRQQVAAELRSELLVVPVEDAVWVFDTGPNHLVTEPRTTDAARVGHLAVVNSTSDSSD